MLLSAKAYQKGSCAAVFLCVFYVFLNVFSKICVLCIKRDRLLRLSLSLSAFLHILRAEDLDRRVDLVMRQGMPLDIIAQGEQRKIALPVDILRDGEIYFAAFQQAAGGVG